MKKKIKKPLTKKEEKELNRRVKAISMIDFDKLLKDIKK